MLDLLTLPSFLFALKALVIGSIFFVWVVRYENIIEEFKFYKLPDWVRDFVGILKLSFALMLFSSDSIVILLGSSGIAFLMIAAVLTHLRVQNHLYKMLPSITLMSISFVILVFTFQSI